MWRCNFILYFFLTFLFSLLFCASLPPIFSLILSLPSVFFPCFPSQTSCSSYMSYTPRIPIIHTTIGIMKYGSAHMWTYFCDIFVKQINHTSWLLNVSYQYLYTVGLLHRFYITAVFSCLYLYESITHMICPFIWCDVFEEINWTDKSISMFILQFFLYHSLQKIKIFKLTLPYKNNWFCWYQNQNWFCWDIPS